MGNEEEEGAVSTMTAKVEPAIWLAREKARTSIEELLKASRDDEDAFELWFQDRIIVRGKEAGKRAIEFVFGGHPNR